MSEIDELKKMRLEQELNSIDKDFVEELADRLLKSLVNWANAEIFKPKNGELTLKISLGAPNAYVTVKPKSPLNPHIEFTAAFIWNMYIDALFFPLICRDVAEKTDALAQLHADETFEKCLSRFDDGTPNIQEIDVCELFRFDCEEFSRKIQAQRKNPREPLPHEVRCRFVLFELMLAWTFFHELGHAIQGHYRMQARPASIEETWIHAEMDAPVLGGPAATVEVSEPIPTEADLAAQARELMADADASNQTLKYLSRHKRITPSIIYLLTCATGCLLQRFYMTYPETLEISDSRHPHPVVRDESAQLLLSYPAKEFPELINHFESIDVALQELSYINVRALTMTGLYRYHRIEKTVDGRTIPSYMKIMRDEQAQLATYLRALIPEVERQLVLVRDYHLMGSAALDSWVSSLRNLLKLKESSPGETG